VVVPARDRVRLGLRPRTDPRGGALYLARADGTLWTAGWNPGLEHGSPINGSLTLVDNDPSQMWASHGMFVRN
jgi:hypothetical protein